MISIIANANDDAQECALDFASVFAALGPVIRRPNATNLFAHSKREVLLAM